ncbi:single-stranded-DNA-specific exonuclease RecJ [Clostridium gasigenes]|uniref:single-stranded-DNA-specific exonuclease RecJ n=1 Tax=Clostridium gasigenes TaxID=94869 RepID=UPI001C0ABE85|nr:single-stranded-DNA-specific exonuclease RecJ [Clostridium gasigenes]MBU3132201.1 single-stranded-DNA-specific exonuclease RecJ [Clostridium gasigenes]
MREKWVVINKKEEFEKLSKNVKENPLALRILANRGISTVEGAKKFLSPDINNLYDGFLLKDMDKGVDIIREAVINNKKIVIYGDYDCDGVISTVILYKALKKVGAKFSYHIPHREEEGYGMHSGRIQKLKDEGYDVILTCDNGISAFEEVKLAKELGMEVVLTDHHDIPLKEVDGEFVSIMPKADAVINPKRNDCTYPFKHLCGAGVALKFSQCLYKKMGIEENEYKELIEYAAISTVCDVVDLLDENRIIVKNGLKMINKTNNKGLIELRNVTGLQDKEVNEYHLGFVIGPCINATGRLETANLSVDLLITEDEKKAKDLAKKLYDLNARRQELTKESAERIVEKIEKENFHHNKVIVVYDEEIHESIAGIVAGRMKERYNLPCIVLTKGKEMPKGSARSIECYNIFEELSKCKDLMSKFGGHPMAAGLSLLEENIPKLREKLNNICTLTEEDVKPVVKIDLPLPLQYLDEDLIKVIEGLRPFGKGNPSPLFAVKDVEIDKIWLIGKEKNYLKLRCKIPGKNSAIDGLSFDKLEYFKEVYIDKYGEEVFLKACDNNCIRGKIDLIYYPNVNEFNGRRTVQLMIKNLRIS